MGYGLWPITDNHWRPVLDDLSVENASVALIELVIVALTSPSLTKNRPVGCASRYEA